MKGLGWKEAQRHGDLVTLQIILVFALTLDLHAIYTAIDTYMHNTGSNSRQVDFFWKIDK
jgi:hypothetical protein